jgi:uncharacterized surface protein with fasciclin (FAS1) repeats
MAANPQPAATTGLDIFSAARANGSFSHVVDALDSTGLGSELSRGGPFTLFAPTDESYSRLSTRAREVYMCDRQKLRELLLHHVVDGVVTRDDVRSLGSVRAQDERELEFYMEDGEMTVSGARIVESDIQCTNGVIHAIDRWVAP